MKEDLNPKLYKFLICKLGLDSLRNSTSKMDICPWTIDTSLGCISNNTWEWKPNLNKLVLSKSCTSSPCHVYLNRQDHALKKRDRLMSTPLAGYTSVKISSSTFESPWVDIVDTNDNTNTQNHFHELLHEENSINGQFDDEYTIPILSLRNGQTSISPCLLEMDSASSSQFYESPSDTTRIDEVPNNDEEEYWKTYNLITPRGGGATTILKEKGKEITIVLDNHNKVSHDREHHIDIDEDVGKESILKDIEVSKNSEAVDELLCVEDVEGEEVISKLRRQIEFDKKTIIKMYGEIDKERNAAAEAARQAMAMITKLQEEKALIDLDALQCQRMMEEDATQDSIALQEAYQLLAQKEKDVQDLQVELQFYRSRYSVRSL